MYRRSITCFASKFFARLDHTTLDDTKFKTYPTVFNNLNIACSKQLHENLLTVKSSEESSDLVRAHASRHITNQIYRYLIYKFNL